MKLPPTPLETQRFQAYSSSADVAAYLAQLAALAPKVARLQTLGRSAQGRPLQALICAQPLRTAKLRVMLVGSQHGASEAAGCEALLFLARDVLLGERRELLEDLELIFIPNANPDGRDLDSSKNGNDVNLNRDYVLLTQPESCALDAAVIDFAPDVILDAHESASYKSKTLGREGYLTDFEAQFDVANTPAIPAVNRRYLESTLLPALIAGVTQRGLRAQRYIREITSLTQPLTHGGFTIRKFRNKAGIRGPLTILLETPMEPKAGHYPTYRNIGVRVDKQRLCLQVFLACVSERAVQIREVLKLAAGEVPSELPLNARFVPNVNMPELSIPLRRHATGELVERQFADHRACVIEDLVVLPPAYVINAHVNLFGAVLARHGIKFETISRAERRSVQTRVFPKGISPEEAASPWQPWAGKVVLDPGTLRIPLAQPSRRIIPLLLDPRAASSVFRYRPFGRLLEGPLFIYDEVE